MVSIICTHFVFHMLTNTFFTGSGVPHATLNAVGSGSDRGLPLR